MKRFNLSENAIKEFRKTLLAWYSQHGRCFPWRKRTALDFEKIIAEILLQRTRAGMVARLLPIFLKRYSSWSQLANANRDELIDIIRPVGLWERRAATLLGLASEMSRRKGIFPKNREEIEKLPGVGQYIASSIMLLSHNSRQPLLDINMARLLERYFGPRRLSDIRYDPYLQYLSKTVVDCDKAVALNWAILDFAAMVCLTRSPRCGECPLSSGCRFYGETVAQLQS